MTKKKVIIPAAEIIENLGLDYYVGNAVNAIHKSALAEDDEEELTYLEEAASHLTRKVELTRQAKLRSSWNKAKKKQRKSKDSEKGSGEGKTEAKS